MPGLDDYGALLRSGSASVPDYAAEEAQKQLRSIQLSEAKRRLVEQQHEFAEEDNFHSDLTTVLAHPSAQGYSALIAKHPKFAQQVKASWELQDTAKQKADLQSGSEIYSAAANGKYDLAAALLQRRVDADKEAGQPVDPHDQVILDGLKSGDPVQQKAAMGMIGYGLAAITGPDKFEQTLGALTKEKGGFTLDAGATRFDAEGKVVAASPYIKTADGGILERDTGGGDPASTAAGGSVSPAASSVATALASAGLPAPVVAGFMGNFHAEGGYDGAQGDGGSASGIAQWRGERAANFKRIIGKATTEATPEEQAKFVAWEMQNPEAAGMTVKQRDAILRAKTPAQAAALIDQHYERSSGRDRNVRMAAANAFAGDISGSPGNAPPGYHWLTPPKPKDAPSGFRWSADGTTLEAIPGGPAEKAGDEFRILTPEEATEKGLDPAIKYQVNAKTGQVTAVGGQSRQAKQITQQVQTKVQPSIDIRDTMARLAGRWSPSYGGHQILGSNLNALQRKLGSWSGAPEGMADWWSDFQAMDNLVRNQLFGSALTEHEKQAYAATTISPTMVPSEIVKTFNRKREIINGVVARQQRFLKANGYDPEAVDEMFSPLDPREGGSSQPVQVRSLQEARKLPSGTLFKTPDGRTLRKK